MMEKKPNFYVDNYIAFPCLLLDQILNPDGKWAGGELQGIYFSMEI